LEVLLESMAELRRWGHNVKLLAVGPFETPEYEAKIRDLVSKLKLTDAIEWTGFTRDVPAQLTRMDLFVLPSLFGEGLPMVVLEAMAAGVPVVATDVEGVTEAVRDGIDGVIARPADPDHLAGAMLRIISGNLNWEELRRSAYRRWQSRFSDVSMAQQVATVYREVAARYPKLAAFADDR
jgi:glycosyltransferase involved in cell wall biosynthesis